MGQAASRCRLSKSLNVNERRTDAAAAAAADDADDDDGVDDACLTSLWLTLRVRERCTTDPADPDLGRGLYLVTVSATGASRGCIENRRVAANITRQVDVEKS